MTVSVIIPVYNAESSLVKCLDSVFGQSKPPHEVIVVNDGSTDSSEAIVREYFPQVIYLAQENAGPAASRNTGIRRAAGKFIAFLDADDYWDARFIEKCCRFLEAHPGIVAVSTGLRTIMHDGTEVVHSLLSEDLVNPSAPFIVEDFFAFWSQHDHVRTGSAVFRKKMIDQAGGQLEDLRVSEDLEYWGYLSTYGKWGYIPEPLWVGNSRAAAASPGWLNKYRKRRALCPTVEAWQQRILPRLIGEQLSNFKVVRGRVAAGYAHNHILGGNPARAWQIVQDYGEEFPVNRLTLLLIKGCRYGMVGWYFACGLVKIREFVKSWMLQQRQARALH